MCTTTLEIYGNSNQAKVNFLAYYNVLILSINNYRTLSMSYSFHKNNFLAIHAS